MKIQEHHQAIILRRQGLTYKEIQSHLNVSKGSLSRWLFDQPYRPTPENQERRRAASIQAGQVLHQRKLKRVTETMNIAVSSIPKIDDSMLHLLGITAYWAEGSKTQDGQVAFTNTDPDLIRLVHKWWIRCCGVKAEMIRLHIRVHRDEERISAESYWRESTAFQQLNATKPLLNKAALAAGE